MTVRIENPDLITRRLVTDRSKKTHLSARLYWPNIQKRLSSVRSQLSWEVCCYTLSAPKHTAKVYVHINYLTCMEATSVHRSVYVGNRSASELLPTRIQIFITVPSIYVRLFWDEIQIEFLNRKFVGMFFGGKRSILDNLESLISTCSFSNVVRGLSGNLLLISDPQL